MNKNDAISGKFNYIAADDNYHGNTNNDDI